jgi:hypothetical protein
MICTDCYHDIRDHTIVGCQHVSHYKYGARWREEYCECAYSREGVQDAWEVLERETVMEQRVVDMEKGMYDDSCF